MKLGFISTYFYPFTGGAEANCYYLAKELAKKHEVHIFTSDRKSKTIINKKEEKIFEINIHRSKTLFRYKYYFAFYPSLLKNLLKQDLDIIHVHSLGFIWHDICLIIKKLYSPKTKILITPHGPFMALKHYPIWQRIIKHLVITEIKLIKNIYDKTIQVNPKQYLWLEKDYKFKNNKIVYIPNGIEKVSFKKLDIDSFQKQYRLKDKFIITFIGRLSRYKGVQNILQILAEIVKEKRNLMFLIIGEDAGYYKNLQSIVNKNNLKNNVLFLNKLNDEEKFKALQLSEIFILPSEWEAFGITILEAMSKENAIISTNTEGGNFLVSENNGLLYKFNDIMSLKKYLRTLIFDNKLRKNMQKNNLKKAKEFTWDKIVLKLEGEYKKL